MKDKYCLVCFKPIQTVSFRTLSLEVPLCGTCFYHAPKAFKKEKEDGVDVFSIYEYSSTLVNWLFRYKTQNDFVLREVFFSPFKRLLHFLYFNYTIVLAPSTEKNLQARGFNHLEEMCRCLELPIWNPFLKGESTPQKYLGLLERKKVHQHISLKKGFDFSNKKILLVDDVMTTGSTFIACASLLKKQKIKTIKGLIAIRKPSDFAKVNPLSYQI